MRFTNYILGLVIMVTLGAANAVLVQNTAHGWVDQNASLVRKALTAVFENDIYVVWSSDKTPAGDGEVFYRVSNDGGKTFTDKVDLSNTPRSDSVDVEISADEGKVAISWWEHTQKTNEPVMRISSDGGRSFGPILKLATNGTIVD